MIYGACCRDSLQVRLCDTNGISNNISEICCWPVFCTVYGQEGKKKEGRKKMRKEFFEGKTREEAIEACPWAAKVVKAEGGYWCFESIEDYRVWKGQK